MPCLTITEFNFAPDAKGVNDSRRRLNRLSKRAFAQPPTLGMRFEMKHYLKHSFCGLALILVTFFSPAMQLRLETPF